MTAYFVTRHSGACDWAVRQGLDAQQLEHLDPTQIGEGDVVMGTLPVHIVAEIQSQGARYMHLELTIPPEHRGQPLSAEDMDRFGACLTEFHVRRIETPET